MAKPKLQRIDDVRWRVPREGGMRTHGIIYADDGLIEGIRGDPCVEQVANVAHLPGIVGPSLAMPDIHWGYGFPIGGVAAFRAGRTLTPTGWAQPTDLAAIEDPEARAAAEQAVAWIAGSILTVIGAVILAASLARALG